MTESRSLSGVEGVGSSAALLWGWGCRRTGPVGPMGAALGLQGPSGHQPWGGGREHKVRAIKRPNGTFPKAPPPPLTLNVLQ